MDMKKLIGILLIAFSLCAFGQDPDGHQYRKIDTPLINAYDIIVKKPEKWTDLYNIPEHPALSNISKEDKDSILCVINERNILYQKDSLMSSDIFYIFKPYFEYLRDIDPHYFVEIRSYAPGYRRKDIRKVSNSIIKYLPFNLLNINDSLIVSTSVDDKFQTGDLILAINGNKSEDILKYNYSRRMNYPEDLLCMYYSSSIQSSYDVLLNRNGRIMDVNTSNWDKDCYVKIKQKEELENNVHFYSDYQCGYIKISQFYPDNSRLIKQIGTIVKGYKAKGAKSIILDLRNNPGGNGHKFAELLSIFIKRESIPYMKEGYLQVSKQTVNDYTSINQNDIGHLIKIKDTDLCRSIKLNTKMYLCEGIDLYVLMNNQTGSIAASFCNILQYNEAAKLVGEPLLHNALKYGETIHIPNRFPCDDMPAMMAESSVSTTEFHEYSKSVDGVLYPDISIPYVAKEYLDGKDAMLEQLLLHIENAE